MSGRRSCSKVDYEMGNVCASTNDEAKVALDGASTIAELEAALAEYGATPGLEDRIARAKKRLSGARKIEAARAKEEEAKAEAARAERDAKAEGLASVADKEHAEWRAAGAWRSGHLDVDQAEYVSPEIYSICRDGSARCVPLAPPGGSRLLEGVSRPVFSAIK